VSLHSQEVLLDTFPALGLDHRGLMFFVIDPSAKPAEASYGERRMIS
jgi:hypothetical protein